VAVLVISDLPSALEQVRAALESEGLTVAIAESRLAAQEALREQVFQTVVLDLAAGGGGGLEVLEDVRRLGLVAQVVAVSPTPDDRARALDLGADEHLVASISDPDLVPRVLAARPSDLGHRLRVGPLDIDLAARSVLVDARAVGLTAMEFDLLAFLATRPGHVFSRHELLRAVWRSAPDWQHASTVTEHVRRLRGKIEVDPRRPQLLRTVRGVGYRLDASPEVGEVVAPAVIVGTITYVAGRVVAVDQAAEVLLGFADAALVGRKVLELVAPDSRGAARQRMRGVTSGASSRSQLLKFTHATGHDVEVQVEFSEAEWNGEPGGRVRLAYAANQPARLRQLVTGIASEVTDAVIVTDARSHIRSWNLAAERLYGWAEGEVIGRHVLDILDDGLDGGVGGANEGLASTGRWRGTSRQRTRTGSVIEVMSSITLLHDEDGTEVGAVSVNRPGDRQPVGRDDTAAEAEIRLGMDRREFEVFYQPVMDVRLERLSVVEALVRWNHPTRGLLEPAAFLGTAERSGLIVQLGAYVLDLACRQAAEWLERGLDMDLAVNLSSVELADPDLVDRISHTLSASGLDATHLWLEVTETSLVEDVDQAVGALRRLVALGIRVAIDDFGTGWASLTYLRTFPVSCLKIDRSFVAELEGNAYDVAIVRSILSLADELGLVVVAEGVETAAQNDALLSLGCRYVQGYLHGVPTRPASVPIDLARRLDAPDPAIGDEVEQVAAERRASGTSEQWASEMVAQMLRALLRIRSARDASELLQDAVRHLGGSVVPASAVGDHALPIDLSLGDGTAIFAVAAPFSVERRHLERVLPRLAEDANQAVHLMRYAEQRERVEAYDELTGLANRRALDRMLAGMRHGVVVMLDLDLVVQVDLADGQAGGDRVLAAFGRLLNDAAPFPSCRVVGDEFAILVEPADVDAALVLVADLRRAWAATMPQAPTFSAGLAAVGTGGATAALLAADRALFRAKEGGRTRTEVAEATP